MQLRTVVLKGNGARGLCRDGFSLRSQVGGGRWDEPLRI